MKSLRYKESKDWAKIVELAFFEDVFGSSFRDTLTSTQIPQLWPDTTIIEGLQNRYKNIDFTPVELVEVDVVERVKKCEQCQAPLTEGFIHICPEQDNKFYRLA